MERTALQVTEQDLCLGPIVPQLGQMRWLCWHPRRPLVDPTGKDCRISRLAESGVEGCSFFESPLTAAFDET